MQWLAHSEDSENNIPAQSYYDHVHGVTTGCRKRLKEIEPYVSPEMYRVIFKSVMLAAPYHDLGKLDDQAVAILSGNQEGRMINHVEAGVVYLMRRYEDTNLLEYLIAAYLVHAHHIGFCNFSDVIEEKYSTNFFKLPTFNSGKKMYDSKSMSVYGLEDIPVHSHVEKNLSIYIERHNEAMGIDYGEITVSVSQQEARKILHGYVAMKVMWSILCDSDHEDTANHYGEFYPERKNKNNLKPRDRIHKMKKFLSKKSPKSSSSCVSAAARLETRKRLFEACGIICSDKYISLIKGTVGSGKTFGLMHHALSVAEHHKSNRIYIVLPYIALIEQSAAQYEDALALSEKDAKWNISQVHSLINTRSVYQRKYTKAFNSPLNITSAVNFFETIMSNRTSVGTKIHKMVGSIIGIDEYHVIAGHEYWPVLLMLMDEMKDFGCRFILSSGTPVHYWELDSFNFTENEIQSQVYEVIDDELYTKMLEIENSRVRIVNKMLCNNKMLCKMKFNDLVGSILSTPGSVFVIMTTRKRGARLHKYLSSKTKRKVFLRSSLLSPKDRMTQYKEKIETLLESGEDIIVIGTLGSDIGLDLSFRHGFWEHASYASAGQIKGRINRNCEYNDSTLTIFQLDLYPDDTGQKVHNNPVLDTAKDVFISNTKAQVDISPVYGSIMTDYEIKQMSKDKQDFMQATYNAYRNMDFEDLGKIYRFINMPTISLLVNSELYEKILHNKFVSYSEIQQNCVQIIASSGTIKKIGEYMVPIITDEDKMLVATDEVDEEEYVSLYYWRGDYDPENYGIMPALDPDIQYIDPFLGV